jgi:hypothetical protein
LLEIEDKNYLIYATMSIDSSAASAFAQFIYLCCCGYIDSLLNIVGIRRVSAGANESACNDADYSNKSKRIERCLETIDSVDLWELRELALSEGGLLQGVFRLCLFVFPMNEGRLFL